MQHEVNFRRSQHAIESPITRKCFFVLRQSLAYAALFVKTPAWPNRLNLNSSLSWQQFFFWMTLILTKLQNSTRAICWRSLRWNSQVRSFAWRNRSKKSITDRSRYVWLTVSWTAQDCIAEVYQAQNDKSCYLLLMTFRENREKIFLCDAFSHRFNVVSHSVDK